MTYRYFGLSEKAKLNSSASIWTVSNQWIKIPEDQLEYLIRQSEFFGLSGKTLEDILVPSDSKYSTMKDFELYYAFPAQILKEMIFNLEKLSIELKMRQENIFEILPPQSEMYYYNLTYAEMADALIDLLQNAHDLNESIETWLEKG